MESDERPAKIRKLSSHHERDTLPAQSTTSVDTPTDTLIQDAAENAPLPPTTASTTTETEAPNPPLSKSMQKKLRKQAEWDAKKEDRKIWRKEKNQAKKERKREEKRTNPEAWKEKQKQWVKPTMLPITLLIDCDFDNLMRDNERISLGGQLTRCYSDNKNAPFRAHLAVCSFNGKLRERFDGVLNKSYQNWKGVRFLDEDFVVASEKAKEWMADDKRGGKLAGVFEKYAPATLHAQAETIYLSADSDYTLTELKPFSTYIIGGLVDKNREKGICAARAAAAGVKTARLPIGDYLAMASRKVLTTNHVHEIMLKWLECGDWGEAFMKVIPKRKGGQLKGYAGEGGEDVDGEGDADEENDHVEEIEEREEEEAEEENEAVEQTAGAEKIE
ncbi:uncharacterized protein M437DRAFT_49786 [Aureobasidium melanogenum CBS 110374]|uniref:tRNA (guanine(9)-N1)-methyltransferase n=1 Tax=Aureobasidium melanogenum (strain CBS 110374) TaxID=1043003 RepID=A0A074VTR4_AURM1|nr:uncharacterized protein M437DRAFT_49786 [Aureobasidium melanogenum CBS 110374]KEQ62619.1 hypothetical protein M437DRAFT_49786 [Aureobasidium melanogenum CBS 110374]